MNNYTYRAPTRLGYNVPHNVYVVCRGNYFADDLSVTRYRRGEITGNMFVLGARGHIQLADDGSYSRFKWDSNRYFGPSRAAFDRWRERTGFDKNSELLVCKEEGSAG